MEKKDVDKSRSLIGRWSFPVILALAGVIAGVMWCLSTGEAEAHCKQLAYDGCHKQQGDLHWHPEESNCKVSAACERKDDITIKFMPAPELPDVLADSLASIEAKITDRNRTDMAESCGEQKRSYESCRSDRYCTWENEARQARSLADCLNL